MKKYNILLFIILPLFFSCKKGTIAVSKIEGKRIDISENIALNPTIDTFIKPYKEKLDSSMNKVLSYTPNTMHKKDGELESTIGNLMADIVHAQAQPVFKKRTKKNIDFTLLNHGGIRAAISKGNITRRTAYQIMPFENAIVVVELTSKKVEEMIAYLAQGKKAHPFSGMTIELNNDYTLKKALINNKPLQKNTTYFVATNDYLQHGGDGMTFLAEPVSIHLLDYKIRNAMLDYFTKTDTISSELDNRFFKN